MKAVTSLPIDAHSAYAEIYAERQRQTDKWGLQHRALGTGSKTYQNNADKAKARCDAAEKDSQSENVEDKASWALVLTEEFWESLAESDVELVRKELVQVAAVAVAIIEDIDANYLEDSTTTVYI